MNYVKSFDLFGVPATQIPATPGSGAPTTATEGAVGCLYMDTDTGNLYKCTSVADGVYTWVEAGNGGGNQTTGLSDTAASLLITILRNGVYSTDQSANITALESELGSSGESGGDEPVIPDEPDEPEVTLSSISATYSGGDVPVDTAVTDLTGIVVTAYYSDGSTATVTGYTLSGEIVEGSNTITVSYGGKTATFTVTGVAESGGEPVEMSEPQSSGLAGNAHVTGWYTDGGTTAYTVSVNYTQASTETFAEDTVVTIAFNATGGILTRKAIAACYKDDVAYYTTEIGTLSSLATPVTYTVKAGYALIVSQIGGNSQGAFTVTKEG